MTAPKYATEEERRAAMRVVGLQAAIEKTGIHAEGYDASQDKALGGKTTASRGVGAFAASAEEKSAIGRRAGAAQPHIWKLWATHYFNHCIRTRPTNGKYCIFCDSGLGEQLLAEAKQARAEELERRKVLRRKKGVQVSSGNAQEW
jgi:hypothetical protein